jgi:chromosome segregation ATPase
VLLTLSSLFLCGIVVTYVASSENYRAAYENKDQELKVSTSMFKSRESDFNTKLAENQRKIDELTASRTQLEAEKAQIAADLATAQRNAYASQERLSNLAGVVGGLNQTISSMDQSLKLSREELGKLRNDQVKDKKNLNEVSAALNEKTVQLEAVEAERRRLLEQKTMLEQQIAKLMGQGTQTVTANAVTPETDNVKIASPSNMAVSMQGKISEMNAKSGLVTLSIGSADGVQVGTRFHVVRGDKFICDVVVTNVDTETSAGVLELVRQQPQAGDLASTSL